MERPRLVVGVLALVFALVLVATLGAAGVAMEVKDGKIADLEEKITTITDEGDARNADLEDNIATITAEGDARNADLESEVSALETENADIQEALANAIQLLPRGCKTSDGQFDFVRTVVGLAVDTGPRGLGVVLNGYILTAQHLVSDVDTIHVVGWSKSEEYALKTFDVVYRSAVYDFALLEPARGETMPFMVDALNFLYEGDPMEEQAGSPVCHFRLAEQGDGLKDFPAFGAWNLMSVAEFADAYREYADEVMPSLKEKGAFVLAAAMEAAARNHSAGKFREYRIGGAFLSDFVGDGASGSPVFVRESNGGQLRMVGIASGAAYFDILTPREETKVAVFTTIEQICEDASEAGIDLCGVGA